MAQVYTQHRPGEKQTWRLFAEAGRFYAELWRNRWPDVEQEARRFRFHRIMFRAMSDGRRITFVLARGVRLTVKYW